MLVTDGTSTITGAIVSRESSDSTGGAGLFAYGEGVIHVSDTTITTLRNNSGGTLISQNGGIFYTTNTQSEFTVSGYEVMVSSMLV